MMRFLHRSRISVVCIVLSLAGADILAKQGFVLSLEEVDDDGKTTPLSSEKPLAIVDINSEIKIQLDAVALKDKVGRLLGDSAVSQELINRAMVLRDAAQKGLMLIDPLTQALETFGPSGQTAYDVAALSKALKVSADVTLQVIGIAKKDPVLYERLNTALERAMTGANRSRAAQNRAVFETAAAYAGELKRTLEEALRKEGAYVQLGAWIVQDGQDRPLHLPGFDDYPEGDYFVVDRWTLPPLNEQQRKQMETLDDLAKRLNKEGVAGLQKIKTAIDKPLMDFLARAQKCADDVETELGKLQKAGETAAAEVRSLLESTQAEQQKYVTYVQSLKDKYAGASAQRFSSGAALLESTHDDLVKLQQTTKAFIASEIAYLEKIQSALQASASNLHEALTRARQALQECATTFAVDMGKLAEGDLSDLLASVRLSQEINTAVLEFGEEVRKHTLDQVPQNTVLNLKRAGARKAGDAVVLKLAAGSAQRQRQVLEERRLDLHRVLPHVEMAIGLIFADPLEHTAVESRFQFAPSYSILLKGFGDRGITYNRLLTPGFGVNLSALDFNRDGAPELGVAAVGSLFRDYLQAGFGYNINADAPYWFFGLRLPLGTLTLPRPENDPQP